MKIGLIDVDGKSFPNLALMKLSAWHKNKGDIVEWYQPLFSEHLDRVYCSKVFSFTPDYEYPINADEIIKGGSGYCITVINGKECFDKSKDHDLPYEIEHIYPDYSIYPDLTKDTAYGFLSRGCPRGCDFCIVEKKEGKCSRKVADLSEFWKGQKRIVLCDPNILACKEWKNLLKQLIDSKAEIDFNQGLDIRLMTQEKVEMLNQIRIKEIHFAWDRYEDKEIIVPKFKMFAKYSKHRPHGAFGTVYTIVNFNTTLDQDLERIYILRELGYNPYVMIYDKNNADKIYRKLQRWVNMKSIFKVVKKFEDYR